MSRRIKQGKDIHQGLISEDRYIGATSKQSGGEELRAENMGKASREFHCQGEWRNEAGGSQGKLLLFCFTSIGTNIFRIVCKPRMSMVTNENGKQGDARQGGLSKTFKAIEF